MATKKRKPPQHGGERAGAGRPAKHADEGPMVPCALKVRPSLLERLRAVALDLEITQADVLEMGVLAAEGEARKAAHERKA